MKQETELKEARKTIAAIRAINVNEFGHVADEAIERLIAAHLKECEQQPRQRSHPSFGGINNPLADGC